MTRLVTIAGVLFCLLAIITVKIYMGGAHEFNRAERDFAAKEYEQAIVHYERVIRWYLPFNSRMFVAVQRAWSIGEYFEDQKKLDSAQKAYLRLRSSLYAIEKIHSPFEEWIKKCNQKIDTLSQISPVDIHYNFRPLPKNGWSLSAGLFFIGWIGLIVGFICSCSDNTSTCTGKRCLSWILLVVLIQSGWLVSLIFA